MIDLEALYNNNDTNTTTTNTNNQVYTDPDGEFTPIIKSPLRVVTGVFSVLGNIPDLHRRSYNFDVNERIISSLQDTINPDEGACESALMDITANSLKLDESNIMKVNLPNGNRSRRIIMFFELTDGGGIGNVQTNYTIGGYFDTDDVTRSFNGSYVISPHANFYVNQIMKVVSGYKVDRFNNRHPFKTLEDCDIITTGYYDDKDQLENSDYAIRPTDVFQLRSHEEVSLSHRERLENEYGRSNMGEGIISNSAMFLGGSKHKATKRINLDGLSYTSNILRSFSKADAKMSSRGSDGARLNSSRSYYTTGRKLVSDTSLTGGTLFGALNQISHIEKDGYVTFGKLCNLFPELKDPNVLKDATDPRAQDIACDTDILARRLAEVNIGIRLIQSISAIALKTFTTNIEFEIVPLARSKSIGMATNDHWAINISKFRGFYDSSLTLSQKRLFIDLMITEVLPAIIPNPNDIGLWARVRLDIFSVTTIDVSLNGDNIVPVTYPSCCEGLIAPIVTQGYSSASNVANNVESLYNSLIAHPNTGLYSGSATSYFRRY